MTAVLIRRGNLARLAAGPVALAVGLGALAVAQGPGRFTTYAGHSGLTASLTVAAGLGAGGGRPGHRLQPPGRADR